MNDAEVDTLFDLWGVPAPRKPFSILRPRIVSTLPFSPAPSRQSTAPKANPTTPSSALPDVPSLLSQLQTHHETNAKSITDLRTKLNVSEDRVRKERQKVLNSYEEYTALQRHTGLQMRILEGENTRLAGALETAKEAKESAESRASRLERELAAERSLRQKAETELVELRSGIEEREKAVEEAEERLTSRRGELLDALEKSKEALLGPATGSKKRIKEDSPESTVVDPAAKRVKVSADAGWERGSRLRGR